MSDSVQRVTNDHGTVTRTVGGGGNSSSPSSGSGGVTVARTVNRVAVAGGRAKTSHKRGTSHSKVGAPKQVTKRGLIIKFYPATYTVDVLILEATSAFLQGVPCACHLDGTSAQVNTPCLIFFFDEQNPADCVVTAVYPNGTQGIPVPAPGRVVFVTSFLQINAQTINAGNTSTFTLTGGSTGIPVGALGVIWKAYFTSPTAGSYIQMAPHSGTIGNYASMGNLSQANDTINGNGILAIDSAGKIDIRANNGNCTVTLYTHGYTF